VSTKLLLVSPYNVNFYGGVQNQVNLFKNGLDSSNFNVRLLAPDSSDYDIGKVDQDYLYDVLSNIDLNGADALFVSCTALPVLEIIDKLEKKLNTIVLSSNQALIWDTLVKIKKNNSVEGFGKLFQVN